MKKGRQAQSYPVLNSQFVTEPVSLTPTSLLPHSKTFSSLSAPLGRPRRSLRRHPLPARIVTAILLLCALPLIAATRGAFAQDGPDIGIIAIGGLGVRTDLSAIPYGSGGLLVEWQGQAGPLGFRLDAGARRVADERDAHWRAGIREAYASYGTARIEARLGFQTLGWGLDGDGALASHFGRGDLRDFVMPDDRWLTMGAPMARVQWFFGRHYVEAMASPLVWTSPLPSTQSPWFLAAPPPQIGLLPDAAQTLLAGSDGAEWDANGAIRLAMRPQGWLQWDLVAGYVPAPAPAFGLRPTSDPQLGSLQVALTRSAPVEWMVGLSAEAALGANWLVGSDHLYRPEATITELPRPADELRRSLGNPQALAALGALLAQQQQGDYLGTVATSIHDLSVRTSAGAWSLDGRARLEWLHNPPSGVPQRPLFWTFSAGASRWALRERLRVGVDAEWHVDPFDHRISPHAEWQHRDRWKLVAGAHLFGGRDPGDPLYAHLTYHTFRDADVAYLRLHVYLM